MASSSQTSLGPAPGCLNTPNARMRPPVRRSQLDRFTREMRSSRKVAEERVQPTTGPKTVMQPSGYNWLLIDSPCAKWVKGGRWGGAGRGDWEVRSSLTPGPVSSEATWAGPQRMRGLSDPPTTCSPSRQLRLPALTETLAYNSRHCFPQFRHQYCALGLQVHAVIVSRDAFLT
ncbi:hypothetical protein J6590_034546 [Homalodisca vitripennis]|nr:hypothetical protein J6590_034546 [Homalodisca vitripennis]